MSPIDRAIAHAGSQAELARKAGCSPQTLSIAIKRGSFSKDLARAISAAVDNTVAIEELLFDPTAKAA